MSASGDWERLKAEDGLVFAHASLEDVRANVALAGVPSERVRYVDGKVEDTIPQDVPDRIALLRLDTDWYESTLHELGHLWIALLPGGVLIIDDYGHWQGARQAVDEFFAGRDDAPMLTRSTTPAGSRSSCLGERDAEGSARRPPGGTRARRRTRPAPELKECGVRTQPGVSEVHSPASRRARAQWRSLSVAMSPPHGTAGLSVVGIGCQSGDSSRISFVVRRVRLAPSACIT